MTLTAAIRLAEYIGIQPVVIAEVELRDIERETFAA